MHFDKACLHSFGYELPPVVVTSDALEERLHEVYNRLKLPKGRLELMSGIRERRFWEKGTRPSDGAVLAGLKSLVASDVAPDEIDCLIFTSVSRDMMEPATATFVHRQLGLKPECLVFDLSNACLGFLNGMQILANMIQLGQIRYGLVVSGETAENLVDTTIQQLLNDRGLTRKSIKSSFASLTIGSGAVALVMGDRGKKDTGHLFEGGVYRANTSHNDLCQGGQAGASGTLMATDSEELLKRGIETAHSTWQAFIRKMTWEPDSIHRFFCHQVGSAHAKLLFDTLQLDPTKNFETLPFLGNVGSVSAPITLAMGIEQGALKVGERAALLGIGSGINCLMLGLEW
jgi:3-oxoacyl-[acyl-carrier-protein] synthase-3